MGDTGVSVRVSVFHFQSPVVLCPAATQHFPRSFNNTSICMCHSTLPRTIFSPDFANKIAKSYAPLLPDAGISRCPTPTLFLFQAKQTKPTASNSPTLSENHRFSSLPDAQVPFSSSSSVKSMCCIVDGVLRVILRFERPRPRSNDFLR